MKSDQDYSTSSNVGKSFQGGLDTDIQEGKLTRAVENQTAKIPSIGYLGLAAASILLSISIAPKKLPLANFVGLWAPSFLLIGLYNKLVKVETELARGSVH